MGSSSTAEKAERAHLTSLQAVGTFPVCGGGQ